MEQTDIQKVYNGDAMVFHKKRFWGGLAVAVIGQIVGLFLFVVVWGAKIDEQQKQQNEKISEFVSERILTEKFKIIHERQIAFEKLIEVKFEYIVAQLEVINARKNQK